MKKIKRGKIAKKVLTSEQINLAPFLEEFSGTHILVGGTAVALQLGHRSSIDFDLIKFGNQGTGIEIMQRIEKTGFVFDPKMSSLLWMSDEEQPETTLFINGVKIQLLDFSRNPFGEKVGFKSNKTIEGGINTVDLKTLGAMKCYAMMYRNKRKDAVDLYYIINNGHSFISLIKKAQSIFKILYKPKYTLETIVEGSWDITEKIKYCDPNHPDNKQVKNFLIDQVKTFIIKYKNV